jgi:sugar lactone lactonase YvrE
VPGFSGDNGPAIAAQLNGPVGIGFDAAGNLYICDQVNSRIRKIDLNGTITTFAGTGVPGNSGDNGPAALAALRTPASLAFDPIDGGLVFGQLNNSALRKIDLTTKVITRIAGTGTPGFSGDGGLATAAALNDPSTIVYDAAGNLYFVDSHNERIRKITRATNIISTIAGTGAEGFAGDGGTATSATFGFAQSNSVGGAIARDAAGNMYISDTFNQRIRYIDAATGLISTIAGTGTAGYDGDLVDAAATRVNGPGSLSLEANGNYVFCDTSNNLIRRVVRNATTLPLSISSVNPPQGGAAPRVTLTIVGSGFKSGATVNLKNAAGATITPLSSSVRYGVAIDAQFDLSAQTPGKYDVAVTNPDQSSRTLANGFEIIAATTPSLSVSLNGSSQLRGGRTQVFMATVTNHCNADILNPTLVMEFPAFVVSCVPLWPADHGPSLDSQLIPDAKERPKLEAPIPLKNGTSVVGLTVTNVPAGGSSIISFLVTASDEFKFAHNIGNINARIITSTTLYDNRSGFTAPMVAARDAAGVDCVKMALNDILSRYNKSSRGNKLSNDEINKVREAIKNKSLPRVSASNSPNEYYNNENFLARRFKDVLSDAGIVNPDPTGIDGAVIESVLNRPSYVTEVDDGQVVSDCNDDKKYSNKDGRQVQDIVSGDPNDKSGPEGPGAAHYIARGTLMTYAVEFENKPEASGSVQELNISDALDTATLDLSTFNLGAIQFADRIVAVPSGLKSFSTDVDLRPAKNLIVRIKAGLTGSIVNWAFTGLDPATGQLTTDATLGFLDPDKTAPQGLGTVSFNIKQNAGLAIGTPINNKAAITFDVNSPIETPTWTNTVTLLGLDTDGDGFPDELELAAKTDPVNPGSTPLGLGTFTLQKLTISKLSMKLDFTAAHPDMLMLSGTLPAAANLDGQVVQVFIGGVYRSFKLDASGHSPKSKTESFTLTKSMFTCHINDKFAGALVDEGIDGSADLKTPKIPNRKVQVYVLFNGGFYGVNADIVFGAKKGKSGTVNLPKK